jgi:hypothetical protein
MLAGDKKFSKSYLLVRGCEAHPARISGGNRHDKWGRCSRPAETYAAQWLIPQFERCSATEGRLIVKAVDTSEEGIHGFHSV